MWATPGFGEPNAAVYLALAAVLGNVESELLYLQGQTESAGCIQWQSKGADAFRSELAACASTVRQAADQVAEAAANLNQQARWVDSLQSSPPLESGMPW
ncbi:MAG: hypothetical protein HIU81_01935 [Acidobacteria bacterium]|nr:hypothetical protein [Acidobacteriota bacterium]